MSGVSVPDNKVIRASAGSGKTFSLSQQYITLLLAGVKPSAILASTFTRKAAGEILDRILVRLAKGAASEEGAQELSGELAAAELEMSDYGATLEALCRNLHTVSVSTLDSFFNKIAMSFRYELDLPAAARVVDEYSSLAVDLRAEAIHNLLAKGDRDVLVDLVRRLKGDEVSRAVSERLDVIVTEVYEKFRHSESIAWKQVKVPSKKSTDQDLARLAKIIEAGAEAIGHKTAAGNYVKFAKCVQGGNWNEIAKHSVFQNIVVKRSPDYYKKPHPISVIQTCEELRHFAAAYFLARTKTMTEASYELVKEFDTKFKAVRLEQNVMLFSDLVYALGKRLPDLGDDVLNQVYFRLDAVLDHILLDEFQDTSLSQWDVLKKLAQRIVGHDADSFFCVGDTKQAIYGWRGGCRQIFEQLQADLVLPDEAQETLSKSYRSSQVVLDAVNKVFMEIGTSPAFLEHEATALAWQETYEEHTAANDLPGYVKLECMYAEEKYWDAVDPTEIPTDVATKLDYVADRIARIAKNHPKATVGVIVGTNSMVESLVAKLAVRKVDASGEGGKPLTGDPAVNVIRAALQLVDHPGDTIAAFEIANSPMSDIVGLTHVKESEMSRVSQALRHEIVQKGLPQIISEWALALSGHCDSASAGQLSKLIDLAESYWDPFTLRPAAFVKFVDGTDVAKPSSSRVRIMTIHKSKGLEFDIVVLPQLARKLGGVNTEYYVVRDEPTGPVTQIIRKENETIRSLSDQLTAAYGQEEIRRLEDDICSLYVAMTRSKYALYMIVPALKDKKKDPPAAAGWSDCTFATVLRRSLSTLDFAIEGYRGGTVLYEDGDKDWYEKVEFEDTARADEKEPIPSRIKLGESVSGLRRSLPRMSPSGLGGRAAVTVKDLVFDYGADAKVRGTIIHALFETVEWIEDFVLADEVLLSVAKKSGAYASEEKMVEYMTEFQEMLTKQNVIDALTKPDEETEVWRERRFTIIEDGKLVVGSIDRAVLYKTGKKTTRAEILDFKTGAETPEAREKYELQLEAYAVAVRKMTGCSNIETRLLFVD
ncbi:MAG: UvrD-helicase domain-containing protein [Candidatus Lindowbacteria bacterium]|nr:UvrD-helicase domain-containing protein [Candidatus Lindowbacteria bacterium]